MSTTKLVTHCGAREVSREELDRVEAEILRTASNPITSP